MQNESWLVSVNQTKKAVKSVAFSYDTYTLK